MTPALDILAGMLCGTLMGLIASAHAAVMLTARPPRMIQQRIEEGGSSNLVTVIVFGLVVVWTILGVFAALAADAVLPDAAAMTLVPNSAYLVAVVLVLVMMGAPAMLFLRDRWIHGMFSLLTALGIYGFLIPNAVIALQNRA
ncbi:MAG: hypothetical protein F4Y63_05410 [Chloroflexi bacterium]|nr:hypothetical protein [Chloroflexota bacterium]MYF79381.1 hypothetical protein [Chloroflexota bacterium]MYK62077.1 hypothetical protein [Chloroflexota bacterium]